MNSSIVFSHLTFAWPDGGLVLDDVSGAFNTGRTGLVGVNGCGKSTLLRLIAGHLRPTGGQVTTSGEVAYLPQSISPHPDDTVADLLGVKAQLDAWHAIESGSTDPSHFETLGDAWDIETRVGETLRAVETGSMASTIDADRPVRTLSGGEAMTLAVAGARLRQAPVTLLDEPTNNLDEVQRAAVLDMVKSWPGTLIIVSHDTGLLELMDVTAELFDRKLTVFGGPYSQWRDAKAAEQEAAAQAVSAARQQVRVAKRQRAATLERTTRSLAHGKQKAISEGLGKAARHEQQSSAEHNAGRAREVANDRIAAAQFALDEASDKVRRDESISIDLPDPGVSASRTILELTWGADERYIMKGPERVALTGRNGVGKTTLIETMLGLRPAPSTGHPMAHPMGQPEPSPLPRGRLATTRVGYLPQRFDILDERASALDNVLAAAPTATPAAVRSNLARLLIRGDAVFRPVADLSGGERFRVALARLLLAEPPAQLLIMDEPTNNLDTTSVDQLVEALDGYHGAILVVSHDADFRRRLGVTATLELVGGGIARHISSSG